MKPLREGICAYTLLTVETLVNNGGNHRARDPSGGGVAPLIAGPGASASVILLMGRVGSDPAAMLTVIAVPLAVMTVLLAALLAASRNMDLLGMTEVAVLGRVFGIRGAPRVGPGGPLAM